MHHVGILPIDGYALLSFACTVEPLRAANILSDAPLYNTVVVTPDHEIAHSSGPSQALATVGFDDAIELDYLFVAAGGQPELFENPRVFRWLRQLERSGVTLGGVSGGTVILAKAGLQPDRRMTVHWEHAAALSEMYPDLLLERSLYTFDRNRITCGGGISAFDMMHALIEQHHGPAFADRVSDWFLHTDIRPAFGAQRRDLAERVGTSSAPVLAAAAAMEANVAEPLSLEKLSAIADVSERHLNRLFRDKVGVSAISFYRKVRLETARKLMRNPALGLTEVAFATGFSSSSHFASAFQKVFGVTPSEDRNTRISSSIHHE